LIFRPPFSSRIGAATASVNALSALSSTPLSTLSKHLSWFQERGILTLERDRIVLHRPDRLRERIQ
jgi:DNA-binding transcriptional ArsR family regulator